MKLLTVRIAQQETNNSKYNPFIALSCVANFEPNQEWKTPNLAKHGCQDHLIPDLGQVAQSEHSDNYSLYQ